MFISSVSLASSSLKLGSLPFSSPPSTISCSFVSFERLFPVQHITCYVSCWYNNCVIADNQNKANDYSGYTPWRGAFLASQGVEVEKGRRQTNCQVGGRHLVLAHAGRHVAQQTQQRPQRLAVLVGQQQHTSAHRLQTELFRHVWRWRGGCCSFYLIWHSQKRLISTAMQCYVKIFVSMG